MLFRKLPKTPTSHADASARRSLLLIAGMTLAAAGGNAVAATYYVAPGGSDANPGSFDRPFKTFNSAARKLVPGDTLYARGGTYVERVVIRKSGTAVAPLAIRAYPGETPVIDGQNRLAANWSNLVALTGTYIEFSGFEVKNGLGQGINLMGPHNTVSRCNVHHHAARGIIAAGDYSLVENSAIWWNATDNCRLSTCPPTKTPNGGWGSGLSAAKDPVNGLTQHAVLRGNTVFNNWGEGLSTFQADDTTLEGNVVYDNWAANLYVSDATNAWVSGNLIYFSANPAVGRIAINIALADEKGTPASHDTTIINNLVKGGSLNLKWWADRRYPQGKLQNVLVAHNTFVDTQSTNVQSASLAIDSAAHVNVQIRNNIVKQDTAPRCINVGAGDITFSANLWSKAPNAAASAGNDVVGSPALALTGPTTAGALTDDYFALTPTSPAIGRADTLRQVLDDYFGAPRDTTPDIGADEY